MNPKTRALLYDIQQAGMLVDRFTNGKAFDDYVPIPCSARLSSASSKSSARR